MKTVQDKDGNVSEVADGIMCHAGKNGALPIMLDETLDSNIFAEIEERDAAAVIEKADYIANHKYKDDRRALHKPIEEQLDMIYWDRKNSTNLWDEYVDAIKLAVPKTGV